MEPEEKTEEIQGEEIAPEAAPTEVEPEEKAPEPKKKAKKDIVACPKCKSNKYHVIFHDEAKKGECEVCGYIHK